MQPNAMTLPPGLESLARGFAEPFMSAIGPSACPTSESNPSASYSPIGPSVARSTSGICNELVDEVRQAVALDLEVKVAQRLETVWEQGQEAARQLLAESRIYQEELSNQVADFRQRQAALELENEQLQQLLTTMLGQLAAWGSGTVQPPPADIANLCKAAAAIPEATPDGSTTASGSVSPLLGFEGSPAAIAPASESSCSGGSDGVWESARTAQKLPDLPAFPFPQAAPQAQAPHLSLVDALGIDDANVAPQQVATFAESFSDASFAGLALPATFTDASFGEAFSPFSPEYSPEVFSPFPVTALEYVAEDEPDHHPDGFIFTITLRKAEGSSFGLATSHKDGVLWIDGVLPGGAAEAWNRQCGSSGAAEKVLLPGDAIVSVNGVAGNSEDMTAECETRKQLRLMVVRNDGPRSTPPPHVAAVTERSSTLRADASEFVPTSAPICTEY
jgi:hypothetical protein